MKTTSVFIYAFFRSLSTFLDNQSQSDNRYFFVIYTYVATPELKYFSFKRIYLKFYKKQVAILNTIYHSPHAYSCFLGSILSFFIAEELADFINSSQEA